MSTIRNVQQFAYYDGVLSGFLSYDDQPCWFEVVEESIEGDGPRQYTVRPLGEVIATISETDLHGRWARNAAGDESDALPPAARPVDPPESQNGAEGRVG